MKAPHCRLRLVLLLAAPLLLGGCIAFPMPDGKQTSDLKKIAGGLVAERASREKVEKAFLGPPYYDFPELRVIGYSWRDRGHILDLTPNNGYLSYNVPWVLCIAFDDRNKAARYEAIPLERALDGYALSRGAQFQVSEQRVRECAERCSVVKSALSEN
jgi:hypothetical protein